MTQNSKKTLHLFRHGETDWNVINKLQGHTDIPLNSEGQNQARTLQKYFAENPVSIFLSSDLLRAKETAQLANEILKRPFHLSAGLRESYMGEIEGRTKEEVARVYGEEPWMKWNSMTGEHADFSYPGAESARLTINRVMKTLKEFSHSHDFESAGICTHGLVVRRLLHHINPKIPGLLPVANCSVYKLEYDLATDQFHFPWEE